LINIEAPVTGPEVAITGCHSQSLGIHIVMREDAACRLKGALESCGSVLDNGAVRPRFSIGDTAESVIAPIVMCLPAPAFGEDSRVPEGGCELQRSKA